MQPADRIRLRHMLDAAREAMGYATAKSRPDLDRDRMLQHSLVRCIEIVGEAANRVSDETRAACPALPWPAIVGMRNRLIHAYFDVDLDRLWDTVVADLPPLVAALEAALAADG
jgi:uncharacterized protein with HEPN domain